MSNRLKKVSMQRMRRIVRVRAKVSGTSERPRLRVTISNTNVSAQLIDDTKQSTIVSATTVGKKNVGSTMTEKAEWLGAEIAKKATAKKVTKVTLDRGSRQYHGRVKAFADAARKAGLEL